MWTTRGNARGLLERTAFLQSMQALQVDLTRYLAARYQNPDRLIRIDGDGRARVHLHAQ